MVSYEELKYVGFVKMIEVKALVLLSNIYDFFKDNSRSLKSALVSVESNVISTIRLINEKLIMLCDYKLGFIDDKMDKYAPNFIKNLVGKLNSCIKENISFIEEFFGPLVHKARTLLEKGFSTIESLIQKCIDAKKSVFQHLVYRTESILEKGLYYAKQALDKTKIVVGGIPIIGDATQSIITIHIDMAIQWIETTTSSIKEYGIFGSISSAVENVLKETKVIGASIIQKGFEFVSQALDTTKSVVGRIPIIGDVAQSIITKQTNMVSHVIETTISSIKEYGIFGTITIATEHVAKELQSTYTSIIQKGFESIRQALDTTMTVVGGIPIIGNATQSFITKHIEMVSQLIETTTSSIKKNGIFGAITLATEHVANQALETSTSIIIKGLESVNHALETTKSVVGGIPFIGDTAQSIITKQTDMVSQLVGTTTSSIKEYGIFGVITSAVKHVVKETQETSASIIQKGTESASQILDTTKSVVGGIPIIGDAAQSIITKQTDMASQLIDTTTSSIKENGIFGAITSAVEHVVSEAQETSVSIIQKGTESASQALDTTKSVIGGIPIIGDAAQSIITKQTDMASQLIDTTTSSIKENGIFGAITSAVEHVVSEAQETGASIIQKGTESASQALDTTKSVIGGIPIIGDAAQSIITKQTDMANQLIDTTTSSVKENGIFGAITSATKNVISEAQATGGSIIQKSTESVNQALNTTKYVIISFPIIGDAAQSIITKQTNMANQLIDTTTSSVKENGIFGAITSATKNVISEAQATGESIIQKSTESASQALDTTKSIIGSIPIIGDAAQSIITKQTDMASQLIDTTTSSVKENGIFGAITSATKNVISEAQATGESIIQKSTESASQALDTTKSVIGSIPIIGDAAQSIITKQTDMASQLIDTTTSSVKENGIFGAITSATKNVISEAQATGESIIQKSTESASQALDTTKSVIGGIPIIGDAAQSIITKQTDMASQLIITTTSSVKENGIIGAITSAAQTTGASIIQKGTESASQALDTTKSVVGGIPIIGDAAQSIITKQIDMASDAVEKSTSSVKKHGLLGAIISAAEEVVDDVGKTTKKIIEKGSESVNKTLEKTTSTVEDIPILGNVAGSIFGKLKKKDK